MCFIRQKEKLEDEHEPEYSIERVSAVRELGTDGPEFLVHWEGGVAVWGGQATSWQTLPVESVLAVWERLDERTSLREQLDAEQSGSATSRAIEHQLAELPEVGSSGVVNKWISAKIRGHWSKGQIKQYMGSPSHHFKLKFEEFKQGEADKDDGVYDLLGADFEWRFTTAPKPTAAIESAQGRVARRTRQ